MYNDLAIFTGRAHPELAEAIAARLGRPLGKVDVFEFSNENIFVQFQENIRQRDVYLVQPFVSPVNTSIIELLIMIDAARRASAGRITVVIPYYAYGRSDKKDQPRVPITARLIANMLETAGADRVLTMNLHAGQIQGFFNIPFDHLYATPVFRDLLKLEGLRGPDVVVVSPDAGGVERARLYSKLLDCPLAIIDKRRDGPNVSQVMHLIGDVAGKRAILVDDIIDTAGTLCNAAEAVMNHGATEVYSVATHGVFSGPAIERINKSVIKRIWVTNSIPQEDRLARCDRLNVVSLGPLLAEAVKRIHHGDSISSLFY